MIDWYDRILDYYKDGRYSDEEVKIFVKCNKITPEEYKDITGKDYIQ